jgi:hypothetical protein
MPQRITDQMIVNAIELDDSLVELKEIIKKSHFVANEKTKAYEKVFNELSLTNTGLIIRDVRILIPDSLQNSVIDLAHQGHQGISKTISLLRTKVWFPSLNSKTTERLKSCLACQATINSGAHIAPLKETIRPLEPWHSISIDHYGPIYPTNEHVMAIYDDGSKFAWVEVVNSVSSEVTCKRLDTIFGIIGIPHEVKTDNSTTFTSETFKRFVNYLGFNHRLITPLWPQANGGVESFMRNLGKVIKTAKVDGVCWKSRLNEFMRNYRATPHTMTKVAPAQLIFRNAHTSRLPRYKSGFVPEPIDVQASANDQSKKRKMVDYANKYFRTKEVNFQVGDRVLVKQNQKNKTMTPFDPIPFEIINIKGTMITARNCNKTLTRNISFFKKWRGEMRKESTEGEMTKEKPKFGFRSEKSFTVVEIEFKTQEPSSNEQQEANDPWNSDDLSAEQLVNDVVDNAVINQTMVDSEEFGSPSSSLEDVSNEASEVSVTETTPRQSKRVKGVPTSYRENRAYKKKQLNSPTQEKRIQKQAKKKNTCFTIQ